jgi:prevent-host-death family protein
MEKRLGISEARKQFATIIDQVKFKGENYVIIRRGEPAAAVVPIEVYERWKEERQQLFETIRSVQAVNVGADPQEVMEAVLEAQQAVRQSSVE